MYTNRKTGRTTTRKITKLYTRGGGISIPIVMALVVAASLAIAVYFIASFMGLGFAVGGTPQYNIEIKQLSTTGFQVSIKNIGSVAITKAELKILDGITNNLVFKVEANFTTTSNMFSVYNSSSGSMISTNWSGSKAPLVNQGQEAVITCAVGTGCVLTVSGYSGNANITGTIWPPNGLIAGRPYKIVVVLHFANGQTREWSTTITAVT